MLSTQQPESSQFACRATDYWSITFPRADNKNDRRKKNAENYAFASLSSRRAQAVSYRVVYCWWLLDAKSSVYTVIMLFKSWLRRYGEVRTVPISSVAGRFPNDPIWPGRHHAGNFHCIFKKQPDRIHSRRRIRSPINFTSTGPVVECLHTAIIGKLAGGNPGRGADNARRRVPADPGGGQRSRVRFRQIRFTPLLLRRSNRDATGRSDLIRDALGTENMSVKHIGTVTGGATA